MIQAFINLGRDIVDADLVAKDRGHAEVCKRVERHQQRSGSYTRHHQRQSDFAGDRQQSGTGDARRFFQRWVHSFQGTGDLDKDEREKIHSLDGDDPRQTVDVERRTFQAKRVHEPFVDIAGAWRQQHLPGNCADKRRQHEWDQKEQLHGLLKWQIGARNQPCEEHANHGAEESYAASDNERIPQRLVSIGLAEDEHDIFYIEMAVDEECRPEDQQHRYGDHDHQHQHGESEQDFCDAHRFDMPHQHSETPAATATVCCANHLSSRNWRLTCSPSWNMPPSSASASWISCCARISAEPNEMR